LLSALSATSAFRRKALGIRHWALGARDSGFGGYALALHSGQGAAGARPVRS
jgi:hypothetical protein